MSSAEAVRAIDGLLRLLLLRLLLLRLCEKEQTRRLCGCAIKAAQKREYTSKHVFHSLQAG